MKQIISIISLLFCTNLVFAQKTINISTQQEMLDAIKAINENPDEDYSLILAPGVYWMDNPDDPEIKKSEGGTPIAQTIHCRKISIVGTDKNPENTVFAVNRGQTQGAIGNFTMFLFRCKDIYTENITYGNYCNVDLNYPLNTSLSRKKRAEAVVQAQLAICSGTDSLVAKNCRFISRLNLCNFMGARYALYEKCHAECTDDALAEGYYKQCDFTFYSSKPFYSTSRGATFDYCDIEIKTNGTQYFTKAPGPIHLKNVRLHCDHKINLAWCKENHPEICSAENVTLNGKPVKIDDTPYVPKEQVYEKVDRKKSEGGYTYIFDSYKPSDTNEYSWQPDKTKEGWYWGTAPDGAEDYKGLVQAQRGARILITPEEGMQGIKGAQLEVAPCKSAGQGFGSATGQYMDICVAMDNKTLTGYGLRIERTPDYDHAIVISIVEYTNGEIKAITTPEKCELYRTPCKINVTIKSNTISATLQHEGTKQTIKSNIDTKKLGKEFMLQHTGTTGASASLIKELKVS